MDTKDSVQLFSISHARLRSNQYFLLMVAHISEYFYVVHHTSLQVLLLDGWDYCSATSTKLSQDFGRASVMETLQTFLFQGSLYNDTFDITVTDAGNLGMLGMRFPKVKQFAKFGMNDVMHSLCPGRAI